MTNVILVGSDLDILLQACFFCDLCVLIFIIAESIMENKVDI